MNIMHTERRAASAELPGTTRIVRQGVLLQAGLGTVGALEFLKSHAVSGAVIRRVLGREQLRQEDQEKPAPGQARRP
jgi:hypothetical protein